MSSNNLATRRRFVLEAGAALAAPAALGGAAVASAREPVDARLAALEDASAIRELQRAYARHVNARDRAGAAALFAQPGRAKLDEAIRELRADLLAGETAIDVAADRRTAAARAACVVQIETPIGAPDCTLVQMAIAQGEGVVRRSERRVLEQTFVRVDGVWKIDATALRAPV